MSCVIDANVFVSASVRTEIHHADSHALLATVDQHGIDSYCPTLTIAETAAAIVRPTGNQVLAQQTVALVETLPGLTLVDVDLDLAREAARIAIFHRLRGADALYVAVAARYGATLVTWDAELLTRGAAAVMVATPADWLAIHRGHP